MSTPVSSRQGVNGAAAQPAPAAPPRTPARHKRSAGHRLGGAARNWLLALVGTPSQRRLARSALFVPQIRHWEDEFSHLSDADVTATGQQLRGRARGGESLDRLLPEVFGLISVASQRQLGLRPFDVQLGAGVVIHQGGLAEVATGEGKTLLAALPTALNAMTGKGVHVTTVNDYLAKRDADWLRPVYQAVGLSVGVLQMQMPEPQRQAAYRSDITYGVASEFGFDFLRDRLKMSTTKGQTQPFWAPWTNAAPPPASAEIIQRDHFYYALVDEADNIFIDEARTPLIISMPTRPATEEEQVVYVWADRIARSMARNKHFLLDEKKMQLELTNEGRQLVRWSNPPVGPHSHAMDKLNEHIERALQSHFRFTRDQHYMVHENKIVIIDEFTGRAMPDRHWREGLHQAVEAKEGVPITMAADHAAQITFQSFYRLYEKLAGMTGTAVQNFWELRRVYKLWVVPVPTNRPVLRKDLPDRVFATEAAKFDAVVADVVEKHRNGRPVLIGTRSVEKSEKLSTLLTVKGIQHQVLNAKQHEAEAEIVAKAGQRGQVMIATNMAGRGTDIKLGPGVAELGGLHVLGTERHEAKRIDRQLAGRAGRQGDPGSSQFYLSLEDELLEGLGPDAREYYTEVGAKGNPKADWQGYVRIFRLAQRRLERRHFRQRVDLLVYEKQRQEILKDLGADPYVD